MRRELPRTLISLAPRYQHFPAEQYEIIVVDNGSRDPPREVDFYRLGANLRVLRCADPQPSPVRAINQGLGFASGDLVGVWIDGARMASPGLLRACVGAAALHPRPVIATLNYQLGPGLQRISHEQGYDTRAEDTALASIVWPTDGYRLFEIATPEIRGGPAGPMLETNALFLRRSLWGELGGYDPAFDEPGGSVVNSDTLLRAVALPQTQLIRILGEGTFHQIHGGLSTSTQRGAMDLLKEGSRQYFRLRGKPLMQVRNPGWLYHSPSGTVERNQLTPPRSSS